MKRTVWLLGFLLLLCQLGWTQERESLGEASRRVRAELARKDLSKVPFYTNDNLPTSGNISLGDAFVAGRKRVPRPAAGITALRTSNRDMIRYYVMG